MLKYDLVVHAWNVNVNAYLKESIEGMCPLVTLLKLKGDLIRARHALGKMRPKTVDFLVYQKAQYISQKVTKANLQQQC